MRYKAQFQLLDCRSWSNLGFSRCLIAQEDEPKTVTVEEGAFTITSTIGIQEAQGSSAGPGTSSGSENVSKAFVPPPRFGSGLAVKQGDLFMYGGVVEDGDKQYTLKDFYSLGKTMHMLDVRN